MTHSRTLPLGHAETEEDGGVLSCLVGLSSLVSCWSLMSHVSFLVGLSLMSCLAQRDAGRLNRGARAKRSRHAPVMPRAR